MKPGWQAVKGISRRKYEKPCNNDLFVTHIFRKYHNWSSQFLFVNFSYVDGFAAVADFGAAVEAAVNAAAMTAAFPDVAPHRRQKVIFLQRMLLYTGKLLQRYYFGIFLFYIPQNRIIERRRKNFHFEPVQHLKMFNTWTLQNGQVFQVFQVF